MKLAELVFWTHVIDYAGCGLFCYVTFVLQGQSPTYRPIHVLAAVLTLQTVIATSIIYFREQLHFRLLGSQVPPEKHEPISCSTWIHVLQTGAFATVSYIPICYFDMVWHEPLEPSFGFLARTFVPFYTILFLRDLCFLAPFHALMDNRWYSLHKTHHEIGKNLQSIHAMHIDSIDLTLENVGAPFLLFLFQYALGKHVGFPWYVSVLVTMHDASLHSVNPYSAMYYNPILDWIFKGNISHQLHHALNKGHLLFVPYHHVWPSMRQTDIDKYNKVFKTNISFKLHESMSIMQPDKKCI